MGRFFRRVRKNCKDIKRRITAISTEAFSLIRDLNITLEEKNELYSMYQEDVEEYSEATAIEKLKNGDIAIAIIGKFMLAKGVEQALVLS